MSKLNVGSILQAIIPHQTLMRKKPSIFVFALLAWVLTAIEVSFAQTPPQSSVTFDTAVKQSLLLLIADLQSKVDRQAAGDQSAFFPQGPINPQLKSLGPPVIVLLSSPVAAQELVNFNARVVHQNGSSDWTLGAQANTGQIAIYTFSISGFGPLSQPTGPWSSNRQIWGGNNTIFRTPGNIFGQLGDIFPQHQSEVRGQTVPIPPSIGPTPVIPPPAQVPAPPAVDPRVVEFLFTSMRQQVARSPTENISYTGERGDLTFGAASVRVPDDHKIGHIELPASWRLFGYTLSFAPNESKHFIIKRVVSLSQDTFGQVIKAKGAKTALIFVHGFNTSFDDALYRNAQVVWDLQYKGLSVLFTWPSRGNVVDYIYDRESAYLARNAFISLLGKLKNDYGIEEVNVLAHSMGNLIVLDSLANYAQTSNPSRIAHLVMAAPDVDRDQFKVLAPLAHAIVGGMTLYASSADRAMVASRTLAGGIPRAGDVPSDGPIVLPNLETIDVTAMGEDIFGLNHDVFAASRDVMEDISALLNQNRPPPRLIQIRAVPDPPLAPRFWRYVR